MTRGDRAPDFGQPIERVACGKARMRHFLLREWQWAFDLEESLLVVLVPDGLMYLGFEME